jgi:hypothetical protein
MKPKLAATAAALVVIALIVARLVGSRLGSEAVAPANPAPPAQMVAGSEEAGLPAEASPEDRRAAEPAPAPAGAAVAPAASASGILSGLVVTSGGAPVAGAQVRVSLCEARDMGSSLDRGHNAEEVLVATATTNANGEFALAHRRGVPLDLRVRAEGYAEQELVNRFAGEHVVIVLGRGSSIFGRVYDATDEAGVAGAKIAAGRIGVRFQGERKVQALTDEAGNYRIDGLPPGAYELSVVSREHHPRQLPEEMERVDLRGGESVRLDMALERGVTLRGRVTDALDRSPIEGAEVSDNWTYERRVTTDADGRYVLGGLQRGTMFAVYVRAEGYGETEAPPVLPLAGETKLDFQLERGREAWGRVVDEAGEPLAGVYVAAVGSWFRSSGSSSLPVQGTDWIPDRTDDQGRFILRDLRRNFGHALLLRQPSFGMRVYDFPPADAITGSFDLGTLVLKPGGSIFGRIVDEHGEPRADVALYLDGTNADRDALAPGVEPGGGDYVSRRELRSDASGRFRFVDVSGGSYRLTASLKGNASSISADVELQEAADADAGDMVLARGGTIQGRVRDPRGAPLDWIIVSAHPEPRERFARRVTYTLTDAQGCFRLEALEATTYSLQVEPFGQHSLRKWWEGVPIGESEIELVLPDTTTISGEVVAPGGEPVGGCSIAVMDPDGTFMWGGTYSAPDGSFRLEVLEGQVQDLMVMLADPSMSFQDPRRIKTIVRAVPSGAEGLVATLPEKP